MYISIYRAYGAVGDNVNMGGIAQDFGILFQILCEVKVKFC